MCAEYGPTRNERAHGQNSINMLKSLSNPKDTYNFDSHTDSERKLFSNT